jgi:hypothetical protein
LLQAPASVAETEALAGNDAVRRVRLPRLLPASRTIGRSSRLRCAVSRPSEVDSDPVMSAKINRPNLDSELATAGREGWELVHFWHDTSLHRRRTAIC